jgi:hypothetical protein
MTASASPNEDERRLWFYRGVPTFARAAALVSGGVWRGLAGFGGVWRGGSGREVGSRQESGREAGQRLRRAGERRTEREREAGEVASVQRRSVR